MQTPFTNNPNFRVGFHLLKRFQFLAFILLVTIFSSCIKDVDEQPVVSVFTKGLNNPRGLKFGPDGYLYVAEAGLGGQEINSGKCPELMPSFGSPFYGSTTGGRISKINANGVRSTVTDKVPTTISSTDEVFGPSDVAFIGSNLYVLLNTGCGRSVPTVPVSIARINSGESFSVIADLGAYRVAHPVAHPPTGDLDPEGSFYSMITVGGAFYSLDANSGELVKVTPTGNISRVVDISASEGHIVPTALAYNDGFYFGNLNVFPIKDGSSNIYKVTSSGNLKIKEMGVTAVLGLAFDDKDRMYVLETTTENPFPTPGTGRIMRINPNGSREVIATGFTNPTALTYGPDGNLYVSNLGFGGDAGAGEIWKVRIKDKKDPNHH